MKKVILFLSLLICFANPFAVATPISSIVFFGDSLTDNGNLYRLLFKFIPRSPPYFQGRFTGGPTWAEHVGNHYYQKNYIDYKIYAYGGATAIFHKFLGTFIAPALLEFEVDWYLLDALLQDKSKVLYSIWIGGNDYLFDTTTDVEVGTSTVVDKIEWAIKRLISFGGRYFLVFNLPDLSRIPIGREGGNSSRLRAMTILNNQKLAQKVDLIRSAHPDVKIIFIDVYSIFDALMTNPHVYNTKYNIHIQNIMDPCWSGGFLFKNGISTDSMREEFRQSLIANYPQTTKGVNVDGAVDFIRNSPMLSHVYKMGKGFGMGQIPCANTEEYVFWDHIHPTAIVHKVLAKIVEEQVDQELHNEMMPSN